MNGHTAMPPITFGVNCTYDMLDSILNGNINTSWEGYGLSVRVWMKQGVILTGLWGSTTAEDRDDQTSLLAWDEKQQDYCNPITVATDDITRLEIL